MYAAIRVRGEVNMKRTYRASLEKVMLTRANHLILMPENAESRSRLDSLKDFVTYGEVNSKTLSKLLEKRARLAGDKKLTKEWLSKNKVPSFDELAKLLIKGEKTIGGFCIKPVFRMRPPSKGYERAGIKKPFKIGGALGYRGEKINELLERML